jgi:chromosome segregation ATPase
MGVGVVHPLILIFARRRHARRNQDLAAAESAVVKARERTQDVENEARFKLEQARLERDALRHDIEGLQATVKSRDEDVSYAQKRIGELEGYIHQLRRDIQLRDDKLDQRHADIQSWTSECDRLRRDLENARSRQQELIKDHETALKRAHLELDDLRARVSSVEVERVGGVVLRSVLTGKWEARGVGC